GLEALGDDVLGGRLRAPGDLLDHVVGGLGLDHHDRDVGGVTGADDTTGDDHVEDGVGELLDGGERHPLTGWVGGRRDEGDAHAADRARERQSGELGGGGGGVDGHHV